jgi:16S rRNA (guanine527-N7)-methyltransferase
VAGSPATAAPIEAVPAYSADLFADRLPLARRFATLLVTDGMRRGLVGPRESGRIWSRHLGNCAVVTELIPTDSRVVDVGSGAGLPGLVIAIRRPDVRVDLVEPLQRRVDFLTDTVRALDLGEQVRVVRGRAEEAAVIGAVSAAPVVTARAVAPLDRLVAWCLPLLEPEGRLVLIKGRSAAAEVGQHRDALRKAGARDVRVVRCGTGLIEPATTVVVARARETR